MFNYVNFHADGGQMCVNGLRRFTDPLKADAFARLMRLEPGHSCNGKTVDRFNSESLMPEYGTVKIGGEHRACDGNVFFLRVLELTGNEPAV